MTPSNLVSAVLDERALWEAVLPAETLINIQRSTWCPNL